MRSQRVPVDLTDGTPVGAHLGLEAGRKRDLPKPLEDLVAIVLVDGIVVEDHGDAGEAGQRGRPQMGHVRNAGHLDFDRHGDLLLDLFGGAAGPLRDDLDVVVGDVGVGLDGKVVEGDDSPAEEHDRKTDDQPAIVQRKIDETSNHYWSAVFCSASTFETTC